VKPVRRNLVQWLSECVSELIASSIHSPTHSHAYRNIENYNLTGCRLYLLIQLRNIFLSHLLAHSEQSFVWLPLTRVNHDVKGCWSTENKNVIWKCTQAIMLWNALQRQENKIRVIVCECVCVCACASATLCFACPKLLRRKNIRLAHEANKPTEEA
jgi:hypothetical protein